MVSDKFKINFNFISNFLILGILFFGGFVWADSNGVWHEAKDVKPGTFGEDDIGVTSESYFFINPVSFTNDVLYKGTELDARYIRLNETSITSNMIVDGTITSDDVAFNYAGSSTKGGSASNSNACSGDGVCEIQNGVTNNNFTINKNAQSLNLVGTDHTYIGFYPDGISSGRKAWFGYGDVNQDYLTLSSTNDILLTATNYYLGSITDNNKISTKSYVDNIVPQNLKDGVNWSELSEIPAGLNDGDQVGITVEADPQVGTLTNGKWCRTDGNAVICDVNTPANTVLSEIQVDNYVSNNGYLTSFTEIDGSVTNEIQNVISNGGLQRDVSNNFGVMNCPPGQILKSTGVNTWGCASADGNLFEYKVCYENDHCAGTPVLCSASAPDSSGIIDKSYAPINWGSWSNSQCGTSGSGWYQSHSSCSTGQGNGYAKCEWIIVEVNKKVNNYKVCYENDHCAGTPVLCSASAPDSSGIIDKSYAPINWGSWSNSQCGTSGSGWYQSHSSCGKGIGSGYAKCKWVLVTLT